MVKQIIMPTTWRDKTVWGNLTEEAHAGYGRVEALFYDHGHDFYVKSIRDGYHTCGSKHYIGQAFDFLKGPFKKFDILAVLGKYWKVIEYTDHFHCELDKLNAIKETKS